MITQGIRVNILIIKFLIILLNYSQTKANGEDVCVIRGMCGQTEFGVVPCINRSEPIILRQNEANLRSLSLLEAMCPHLHGRTDPSVCCTEWQLETMFITIYNFAHQGFNHCPSCLKNLEKLFCEMNCSPKQNQFIKVKKTQTDESGHSFATEVDYYLTEGSANQIFESCRHVRNFEGKVIDSMCGGLKGDDCTVSDWLNFLGTSILEEGISPFRINFYITNEKTVQVENDLFEPSDEKYIKCSEKANTKSDACDCHHCPDSCDRKDEIQSKRLKRDTNKCLMRGICGETAFGAIPCVSDEEPKPISNPIALEELKEMCPHLATSDTPTVCCTEDQIIRLNQTFEMVSMFLKECPACVRNFEKIICHLSCGTDQQNFMKVVNTKPNDSGNQMVTEVQYFVNDDWVKGIYDSCKGVHRLGFNVLDHYCKPYKAQDCDHQKFIQFIGGDAEHFGHSPFEITYIFTNEETVESDGVQYKPVKQPFYKCSDNPHTGEGVCPCLHCDQSCAPGEVKKIERQLPKFKGNRKRSINPEELDVFKTYLEDIVYKMRYDYETHPTNELCILDTACRYDKHVGNIPCLKIRKPIPLTDRESLKIFRNICPQLAESDVPYTCCEPTFIHRMNSVFKLLEKLGLSECPSCIANLRQILCQFTCSPKQNQMIRVLNTTKSQSIEVIHHLEYYIDHDFAQGLFDSCKSVYNGTVMNTMCGKWGQINKCSVQKWFDFMGLSVQNGGYSPFQMDVKLMKKSNLTINGETIYPMNQKAFACSESPTPDAHPCACAHCPEACL